jgi:hypothetical protein
MRGTVVALDGPSIRPLVRRGARGSVAGTRFVAIVVVVVNSLSFPSFGVSPFVTRAHERRG